MSRHSRFGTAWVLFAGAVALHVIDEATHDFLSFYNPNALMIRQRFGIAIPTFTFAEWLIGLCAGIALLLCLSPLSFRSARWLRMVALPLAVVVGIFNASLHIGSSIYYRRFMPGAYSSPVLLVAGALLLYAATVPPASRTNFRDETPR